MTLTVVVGASGSGKTTFLNQVHDLHQCTYLRQYHTIRPYIVVSKIPNFNPRKLPYWKIYEKEGTASSIVAGGTYGGKFIAGLSGGQRKLLLFEMVYQRCRDQSQLLIVFDEPFAGVTDDFVPFVVDRLNKLRRTHNLLLVTNDHVETLTKMADNTITVSAIDRTKVQLNDEEGIDRNLVLMALSVGYEYKYADTDADLKFFIDVEITTNKAIRGILVFTLVAFSLFVATFWDSQDDTAALLMIASGIISFFCIQPYLVALTDWRECMLEEAEALVHASPGKSKALKTIITVIFIVFISIVQFFAVNIATGSDYMELRFWIAMLGELFSLCFPGIVLGVFSRLPFQLAQTLAALPFLLVIFFSTTYSPGAGVPGLKGLRYLFSRFYFFCMLPYISEQLDDCPEDKTLNVFLLVLTSLISLYIFLAVLAVGKVKATCAKRHDDLKTASNEDALEVERLQDKMYSNSETIISLCVPPPEIIIRDPTIVRPDPSGLRPRYKYPAKPKFKRNRDHSVFGMTVIGA